MVVLLLLVLVLVAWTYEEALELVPMLVSALGLALSVSLAIVLGWRVDLDSIGVPNKSCGDESGVWKCEEGIEAGGGAASFGALLPPREEPTIAINIFTVSASRNSVFRIPAC